MGEENQVAVEHKEFDLGHLKEILKRRVFPKLKEPALETFESIVEWVEHGVSKTSTKADDFAVAILVPMKSKVTEKLSEIWK